MKFQKKTIHYLAKAILLIAVGLLLNIVPAKIVTHFELPVFFDCLGTILTAMMCGNMAAVIVGFISNAINGLSELLTRRLKPETVQRALDMAKVLHQSAKGASELLDNLLIWARTQQNTIQFNPETLHLHSITADTLNEIKVQAERKHIMLINSTTTDDTVWADKPMLQTIIRNIVSNAIKFTNEGGLIVISSSQTADNTEITIEDNGVGMTQETIQKIVGSTELNSTKGTSGETGTGMGLIISKEFIQRHKGTLKIESTVGKGSSFIINLPSETKLNEK